MTFWVSEGGLKLETSALKSSYGANLTLVNLIDLTNFSDKYSHHFIWDLRFECQATFIFARSEAKIFAGMRKLFKAHALPCLNFRYQQCFKLNLPFFVRSIDVVMTLM